MYKIDTRWHTVEERNACRPPHNHSFCSASILSFCLLCSFIIICLSLHLLLSFLRLCCVFVPLALSFSATLSLHLSVSSPFLSPALLLTSSAVLRPLHEANAHSGLAVAACMRSTGGPIKRRQEQEMERETGSARPQGPRRYHHCPPLCVRSGACLKTTSDPLPPLPPPSLGVCPQLKLSSNPPQDSPVCVLWVLAVRKTPQHPHVCVFSSGCPQSQNPRLCNPEHCTLTSCCVRMCVRMCAFSDAHTCLYTVASSPLCVCVFVAVQ